MVCLSFIMLMMDSAFGVEVTPATETASLAAFQIRHLDDAGRQDLLDRGRQIYANQCAACHGERGEGVEDVYAMPLVGDRSIPELARLIDQTMPEGESESCTGEDAIAASIYAHEAFYGEAAQQRLSPPRVALTRLTAEQYRQSLTDVYAHFRPMHSPGAERGMKGIYFDHSGWQEDKKAFERVDPQIDFDYAMNSPGEGIQSKMFSMYWSGGLLVPETGRYEIIVEGMGAFQFHLIDTDTPFFDNRVQSGDKSVFKRSVELLGGRVYPIKLEFYKRERKTGDVPASIALRWRRPHGVEEVIPTRNLVVGWFDKAFAPQVPFPADDRSAGYERGSTVSRQWDEAVTKGAIEFADALTTDLWPHYAKDRRDKEGSPQGRDLLKQFAYEFVDAALGRPAGDEMRNAYVDSLLQTNENDDDALRRIALLTLKSPRFLYPQLGRVGSADFDNARRLASVLWDSLPSEHLWELARAERLHDQDALRDAAWNMIDDPRAKTKIREALHFWLNLSRIVDLSKDQALFAGYDDALVSDLRLSLDLFLDAVVASETSDFRELLRADWSYTTPRMASFYGEAWNPTGEQQNGEFSRTTHDAKVRRGVVTHPLLMSGLAYNDTTSPIHRGVFLTRYMLGRVMRPPNEAFSPLSPSLHESLTTRERTVLQTGIVGCQSCHSIINGLGFGLENFDAAGRLRTEEKSKPIDASANYIDRLGEEHQFVGVDELTNYLIASDDAQTAFINRMFLHFVKQPIGAYGNDQLNSLKKDFCESGYNIRRLIVQIAVIAASGPPEQPLIVNHD